MYDKTQAQQITNQPTSNQPAEGYSLPAAFAERMKEMLGEEYAAFVASYDKPVRKALRVNTLKSGFAAFEESAPFDLERVPWAEHGYYYSVEERPGKHPFHEAGVYYMQEASAMAVGALSGVKPGDAVLDLCAAPGGKSTQVATMLQGEGYLVSNEIHPERARILSQNIERMGIRNAIVTNADSGALALRFPATFDVVIVDAPCSGEGMFRKEEQAIPNWSVENTLLCGERQDEILDNAAVMVADGGTLVYSTCTFAPVENEGSIGRFLKRHEEFEVVDMVARLGAETMQKYGFAGGHPEWMAEEEREGISEERAASIKGTIRLWPHLLQGEGHYLAVLHKRGEKYARRPETVSAMRDRTALGLWKDFCKETLVEEPKGTPVLFGSELYLLPVPMELKRLKVVRPGLHLGTVKKNRFEPSHALAMALNPEEVVRRVELSPDEAEIAAFLRGESPRIPEERVLLGGNGGKAKGWTLVTTDGYSIGWGKMAGGMLKNHYPKGLRR